MEQRLHYIHCRYGTCFLACARYPDTKKESLYLLQGLLTLYINHFIAPMQFILLLSKCNSWRSHISVAVTCGRAEV